MEYSIVHSKMLLLKKDFEGYKKGSSFYRGFSTEIAEWVEGLDAATEKLKEYRCTYLEDTGIVVIDEYGLFVKGSDEKFTVHLAECEPLSAVVK